MLYKDKILFEKELEALLKPLLKSLYLKWNMYDASMVHQAFTHYICGRNNAKILKLVNSRKRRKLKFKKLKSELENVKVAQELNKYVEAL